jgi:hypothetical protein
MAGYYDYPAVMLNGCLVYVTMLFAACSYGHCSNFIGMSATVSVKGIVDHHLDIAIGETAYRDICKNENICLNPWFCPVSYHYILVVCIY